MQGGDAVYEALKVLGVEHVFAIVSIHNMPILDAVARKGDIQVINVRHEQAGTHSADAYARTTGKLGVMIASTGPGTTNTMTGLYEAFSSSSPVLLITGQAALDFYGKGLGYVHEAENQVAMLQTVTKCVKSVRQANRIGKTILHVAEEILSGRPGPGAVEIPINLQYETVTSPLPSFQKPDRELPSESSLEEAAQLLSSATKPVILAGGGALFSGCQKDLRQLAESLNAPVFTSTNGRGILPEDHPLAMGNIFNSQQVQKTLQQADVTLAVGTRFQVGLPGRSARNALPGKLIHINIDPRALNRLHTATVAIQGDAQMALQGLMEKLNARPANKKFLKEVQKACADLRAHLKTRIGGDYAALLDIFEKNLPRDANAVKDSTVPAYNFANQILPVLEGSSVISTTGAIGPGLPFGIGAALGTGKKTLVIHGDGGFMLHGTELATAAQHKVPVVICIFNDGGYGILRSLQSEQFEGRTNDVNLGTVDFKSFAESMGVPASRVASTGDFQAVLREAFQAEGPYLIDIDMTKLQPMKGSVLPPPPKND